MGGTAIVTRGALRAPALTAGAVRTSADTAIDAHMTARHLDERLAGR